MKIPKLKYEDQIAYGRDIVDEIQLYICEAYHAVYIREVKFDFEFELSTFVVKYNAIVNPLFKVIFEEDTTNS